MKNEIFIIILLFLIFVALSGCINQDEGKIKVLESEVQNLTEKVSELEKQRITPSPTSSQVDSVNLTNVTPSKTNLTNVTPSETDILPTPTPTILQQKIYEKLPPSIIYVSNEMKPLIEWGNGKYELQALRVTIINQQNSRLSIKGQIISEEKILEEKSLILEQAGSSYSFSNENQHVINNTNVTLRLFIQDYEPIDYMFKIVTRFD